MKGFWLIPSVLHRQVKCNIEETHLVSFVRQLPTKPLLPKAWRVISPMKLQLRSDQFLRPRGGAEVHSTVKLVLLCASGKGGVTALSWKLGWAWQTCNLAGLVTKQIPSWGGAKVGKSTVSVNLAYMFGRSEHSAHVRDAPHFLRRPQRRYNQAYGQLESINWIQIERSRLKEVFLSWQKGI